MILPAEKATKASNAGRELSDLAQSTLLRLESAPDQVSLPTIISCHRQETFDNDESLECSMLDAVSELPSSVVLEFEFEERTQVLDWPLRDEDFGEYVLRASCLRFMSMSVQFREVASAQFGTLPDGARQLTLPTAWKSAQWSVRLPSESARTRVIRVEPPIVE